MIKIGNIIRGKEGNTERFKDGRAEHADLEIIGIEGNDIYLKVIESDFCPDWYGQKIQLTRNEVNTRFTLIEATDAFDFDEEYDEEDYLDVYEDKDDDFSKYEKRLMKAESAMDYSFLDLAFNIKSIELKRDYRGFETSSNNKAKKLKSKGLL